MSAVEQAWLAPSTTKFRELLQRIPIQNVNLEIAAIGQEDEFLVGILRKGYVPSGACAPGIARNLRFFYESAVGAENLNSVGTTVTHIDQAVLGRLGTVDGADKLLG